MIGGYIADADASFGGEKKPAAWSEAKPTGVMGEGERCIVAESVESLRMSFGGVIMMEDLVDVEVGDGRANGGGPTATSATFLFSKDTKSPRALRPFMVWSFSSTKGM